VDLARGLEGAVGALGAWTQATFTEGGPRAADPAAARAALSAVDALLQAHPQAARLLPDSGLMDPDRRAVIDAYLAYAGEVWTNVPPQRRDEAARWMGLGLASEPGAWMAGLPLLPPLSAGQVENDARERQAFLRAVALGSAGPIPIPGFPGLSLTRPASLPSPLPGAQRFVYEPNAHMPVPDQTAAVEVLEAYFGLADGIRIATPGDMIRYREALARARGLLGTLEEIPVVVALGDNLAATAAEGGLAALAAALRPMAEAGLLAPPGEGADRLTTLASAHLWDQLDGALSEKAIAAATPDLARYAAYTRGARDLLVLLPGPAAGAVPAHLTAAVLKARAEARYPPLLAAYIQAHGFEEAARFTRATFQLTAPHLADLTGLADPLQVAWPGVFEIPEDSIASRERGCCPRVCGPLDELIRTMAPYPGEIVARACNPQCARQASLSKKVATVSDPGVLDQIKAACFESCGGTAEIELRREIRAARFLVIGSDQEFSRGSTHAIRDHDARGRWRWILKIDLFDERQYTDGQPLRLTPSGDSQLFVFTVLRSAG
jgi:hypothetical protein